MQVGGKHVCWMQIGFCFPTWQVSSVQRQLPWHSWTALLAQKMLKRNKLSVGDRAPNCVITTWQTVIAFLFHWQISCSILFWQVWATVLDNIISVFTGMVTDNKFLGGKSCQLPAHTSVLLSPSNSFGSSWKLLHTRKPIYTHNFLFSTGCIIYLLSIPLKTYFYVVQCIFRSRALSHLITDWSF